LKEETLDCALWISGFGRGGGPVKRQTTKWMHIKLSVIYHGTIHLSPITTKCLLYVPHSLKLINSTFCSNNIFRPIRLTQFSEHVVNISRNGINLLSLALERQCVYYKVGAEGFCSVYNNFALRILW
jgi:hypothetical protein